LRILIPSIQTPFIKGGADLMVGGLKRTLLSYGHEVDTICFPFKFSSKQYIFDLMEFIKKQNLDDFGADLVISLQFPVYYLNHENRLLWLMHQHRAVYELFDNQKDMLSLRDTIIKYDNIEFKKFNKIFAISKNVSKRLKSFNNIGSKPLYHPPADEDKFYCDDSFDYIFFPSRLERLKRQDLLIEAMQYTKTPIKAIIAGVGGERENYQHLINGLDLNHKVKLIGEITQKEKFAFFANSLAIIYPPFDEDYGYITLEAMLSSKAVITSVDSGGVLEFVEDNSTGFIINPNPKELAEKIDWLYFNKARVKEMGERGKELYLSKNISWQNVVSNLLEGI
jgi:glycosyltransferase involved in cell wall biosynthesis